MSYFVAKSLNKSFEKEVLKNFSITLKKGEIVSLVGESGSGKSTLLRILGGLLDVDQGEVYLGDMKILPPKQKLVPGYDEIQLIHQDYGLFPSSSVEDNLKRPLLAYDSGYSQKRIRELIQLLRLEGLENKLPRQLSGGQQQKVAIGKALSIEPEVLLLDEPFSNLDAIQTRELISELKEIFEKLDMTVIFVTHHVDDALLMSDRVIVIQSGEIVQEGNASALYYHPKSLYVAKLFSTLNVVNPNLKEYIRPADVKIFKSRGIKCEVVGKSHLTHFDLLTINSKVFSQSWQVEDKERRFEKGDHLYVQFDPSKVMRIKK
jgi:ABC-type Fe3+/spermidine/putrescine transport system ATPase subunit